MSRMWLWSKGDVYMTEIEELKREFRDSQNKQNEINEKLLQMLMSLSSNDKKDTISQNENNITVEIKKKEYNGLKQPRPDDMIRIQSLTKGELCLNVGSRTVISFSKYGDIKPVLYSELMSIVNSNRSFAETGAFYIIDDASVYYLGLSRFYNDILSYEQIDSLDSWSDDMIRDIIPKIPDRQKEVISLLLATKMFNDERVDRNKVDLISKYCNIDIVGKAREMREIANNMK